MRFNPWVSPFVFGLFIVVLGCGGGEDGLSGANASLRWDPVIHHTAVTYTVHYGRQSSGAVGSCNYENSVDVSEPDAFITGLEFNTQYYFAVSAYSEQGRSQCSNEASKLTPEAPPVQIGEPPVRVASATLHFDAEAGVNEDRESFGQDAIASSPVSPLSSAA